MSIPAKQFIMSYSHAMQDIVALELSDNSKENHYLEIGAGEPTTDGSNTSLLEHLGWEGVSIEKHRGYEIAWERSWRDDSRVMWEDALDIDYNDLPWDFYEFVQVDVDDAKLGYEIIKKMFEQNITTNFLTYEHDIWSDPKNEEYKQTVKEFMTSENYVILAENVHKTSSKSKQYYEDWYAPKEFKEQIEDKDLREGNWLEWCYRYQTKYCPRHYPVIRG